MILLDGTSLFKKIKQELKQEVKELIDKNKLLPHLVALLVGDNAASQTYVNAKVKACDEIGFKSTVLCFNKNIKENELINEIHKLNNLNDVHGIIVQLPLPAHIDEGKITHTIDYKKDVDGFHPINVGNLASGYKAVVPCTPLGCLFLIKKTEKNLSGKHAVILGRSNLNGKPMAQLLLKENCTVTIVHSKTKNLKQECQKADILVAAVGVANLVKDDWVKKDSIIIDVGINKIGDKIVGDVQFDTVKDKVRAITPVPGGVGPMTIACLLKNTLDCFKDR